MPVMSVSVCPSRALIPPDAPYTAISPPALQHDTTSCHNRPACAASSDTFSHESPRSPVVGDVRTTPRSRYPEGETTASADVVDHHASPVSPTLNGPTVPQVCTGPSYTDDFDSIQASLAGPIRAVKSHSRRQPPGHIPRPRNAFILYRSWYVRQGFLTDVESDHREISRIVGKLWKGMKEGEKATWKDLAEKEKQEHAQKYPNYKYSPNSRRDAASSQSGTVTARTSAPRTRKANVSPPSAAQTTDAGGLISSTGELDLTTCVNESDPPTNRSEVTSSHSPPILRVHVPPFKQGSPEPQSPLTPAQIDTLPDDSAHTFLPFNPSFTLDERPPIIAAPGTFPALDAQPNGDSSWSLASCSATFPDSTFASESDPQFLLSQSDYYDEGLLHMWALRPGFDGGETLNSIMTCDNSTNEFRPSCISAGDSHLYYPTSPAASQQFLASETELSPFDRIALEGTEAGHPGVASFETPLWGGLFQSSPASSLFHNADSASEFSSDVSSGRCPATEDSCSTSTGITSVVSEESLDQSHRDCGLFSEWCNPDSPVVADSDCSSGTPAGASSGAPSPPLSLAYAAPTRSQKLFGLSYPRWESHEDLDAYQHAIGGIKAELDDHGIIFSADGRDEIEWTLTN